jgi:glutamine amidotransferase
MIAIIDYGLGNISAFVNVYNRLNIPVLIAKNSDQLREATKLILPGVGSFDFAMQLLNESGMRETLDELVLQKNTPVLGICVGMQILAKKSEEGILPGLGWIDGEVKRFDSSAFKHPASIPHMGWNDVVPVGSTNLMQNLENDARYYFLHSYYFKCNHTEDIIATSDYGIQFACAVGSKNIFGVQFHPEKSHGWGIQLLKNFALSCFVRE